MSRGVQNAHNSLALAFLLNQSKPELVPMQKAHFDGTPGYWCCALSLPRNLHTLLIPFLFMFVKWTLLVHVYQQQNINISHERHWCDKV